MKKILLFLSCFLLLSGTVFASIDALFSDTEKSILEYNKMVPTFSNPVKAIIGNERILLNVEGATETRSIFIIMKNAEIVSYSFDIENIKPTLTLNITEEASNEIINSPNQAEELKTALKKKEVTLSSKNVFKKTKIFFLKLILKFIK